MAHYFLYGAGGHGKVVADLCRLLSHRYTFVDDKMQTEWRQVPSFGYVTIGDNRIRKSVVDRLKDTRHFGPTLVHPRAYAAEEPAFLGSVIMAAAVIQPNASVGRHCIVNTNATVDHDCVIGDFVHVAPGATLCGGVTVGEGTLIGAGATVVPGVKIGRWQLVKAGSVVKEDVPDGNLAAANA